MSISIVTPSISLPEPGAGTWNTLNAADYTTVPQGATAVLVRVYDQLNQDYGVRKTGTTGWTDAVVNNRRLNTLFPIPLTSGIFFDLYGNANFYLVGFLTDGAVIFDDPVDAAAAITDTSGNYFNCDLSPYIPAGGANGAAILAIASTDSAGRIFGARGVGEALDDKGRSIHTQTWIVPLNASRQFEFSLSSGPPARFWVLGYLSQGHYSWYGASNPARASLASGVYEAFPDAPATGESIANYRLTYNGDHDGRFTGDTVKYQGRTQYGGNGSVIVETADNPVEWQSNTVNLARLVGAFVIDGGAVGTPPSFNGPDIPTITGTEGVPITPLDVSGRFDLGTGTPLDPAWNISPAFGLTIDNSGVISGTPVGNGTSTNNNVSLSTTEGTAVSNEFDVVIDPAPGPGVTVYTVAADKPAGSLSVLDGSGAGIGNDVEVPTQTDQGASITWYEPFDGTFLINGVGFHEFTCRSREDSGSPWTQPALTTVNGAVNLPA